jgi:hypothetical protein
MVGCKNWRNGYCVACPFYEFETIISRSPQFSLFPFWITTAATVRLLRSPRSPALSQSLYRLAIPAAPLSRGIVTNCIGGSIHIHFHPWALGPNFLLFSAGQVRACSNFISMFWCFHVSVAVRSVPKNSALESLIVCSFKAGWRLVFIIYSFSYIFMCKFNYSKAFFDSKTSLITGRF